MLIRDCKSIHKGDSKGGRDDSEGKCDQCYFKRESDLKFGINQYPFAYGVWMPKNFAVLKDGENNKGRSNRHENISSVEKHIGDDRNKVSDVTKVSTVNDISRDRADKNRKANAQGANLRNEEILNKNKYKKEKAQEC